MMDLDASFDSGNIEVLDATDPRDIQLAIRKDHNSEFYQWFHFRLMGARGQQVRFHITNAAGAAYAKGWAGYNVVASDDGERWFRVPTTYKDGVLIWGHTPHSDVMTYAYFAPYPLVRHRGLLAHCGASSLATVDMLGRSVDGRAIERVRVGTGPVPLWVIARQHPGESMAEWWMEGFLTRLLDPSDALARGLREVATLHVVPNMNPDGSFRGHLRTNAVGTNLNRAWHEPTVEESPEVLAVRNAMDEAGCALALDVHGDEDLPYNFIAGPEGVAGVTAEVMEQLATFKRDYASINPDFQVEHGYELDAPGEANLTMCTNQITHRYGTLGMTLEMPFKDTTDTPDLVHGWSPVRCRRLGADVLFPLVQFLGPGPGVS